MCNHPKFTKVLERDQHCGTSGIEIYQNAEFGKKSGEGGSGRMEVEGDEVKIRKT